MSARPSDPKIPKGIVLPSKSTTSVFEGEGTADRMMAVDWIDEYAMAAEISEVEALEPRSLSEAKRHLNWPLWESVIKEGLATLKTAGTWEIVDTPPNTNIVSSKWVFRAKKDAAGNVIHYKARLVAQGFSQVPSVDYFDMFAPVAKLASIHTVLAIPAELDLELHQIDIKGAYLNSKLTKEEQIYMCQPPGYEVPGLAQKVCHLLKCSMA